MAKKMSKFESPHLVGDKGMKGSAPGPVSGKLPSVAHKSSLKGDQKSHKNK